jgi:adenine phosphoribosyltransferase
VGLDLTALLRERVVDVPDFPSPGIVFKDIAPVLADHVAFAGVVDAIVAEHGRGTVDKVVGIEARGFLLAAPVAYHEVSYDLEYGTDALQVHVDAFAPGERVLVVDDVLATGGTASAAVELVKRAGAVPVGLSVLLELSFLPGRATVVAAHPGLDVHALLTV